MYSVIYTLTNEYYKVWYWVVLRDGEVVAEGWADTIYAAQFAAEWKIAIYKAVAVVE